MQAGNKIVENLFFGVTCISIFTCTLRSDYNFAMGLLCYYLIKNAQDSKLNTTAKTVSLSRQKSQIVVLTSLRDSFFSLMG